jgi:hypothetical protein
MMAGASQESRRRLFFSASATVTAAQRDNSELYATLFRMSSHIIA